MKSKKLGQRKEEQRGAKGVEMGKAVAVESQEDLSDSAVLGEAMARADAERVAILADAQGKVKLHSKFAEKLGCPAAARLEDGPVFASYVCEQCEAGYTDAVQFRRGEEAWCGVCVKVDIDVMVLSIKEAKGA